MNQFHITGIEKKSLEISGYNFGFHFALSHSGKQKRKHNGMYVLLKKKYIFHSKYIRNSIKKIIKSIMQLRNITHIYIYNK